jgi:hypothetical protein
MAVNRKPRACRGADVDAVAAQRDAAIAQLRAVLALFNRKEFMAPTAQRVIAQADAFIVESERW